MVPIAVAAAAGFGAGVSEFVYMYVTDRCGKILRVVVLVLVVLALAATNAEERGFFYNPNAANENSK